MASTSNKLTLNIPGGEDVFDWVSFLKENFEKIDDAYHTLSSLDERYVKPETMATELTTRLKTPANFRMEIVTMAFFTNGSSSHSTNTHTFATAYTAAPTIIPANITTTQPYVDTIVYPFIHNVDTNQFSVQIKVKDDANKLGTFNQPANVFMKFLVIGA